METHIVSMGGLKVRRESGLLLCLGLGSCVGVALYDAINRVGAMAHVMLPGEVVRKTQDSRLTTHDCSSSRLTTHDFRQLGKYADLAAQLMVEKMIQFGSFIRNIKATLVGGANMFPDLITDPLLDIGQRNVAALKQELHRLRIELVAEETGGFVGRTAAIDISNGKIDITAISTE